MDTASVRAQLKDVNEQVGRVEKERDILLTLRTGLEGWLSLHVVQGGTNGEIKQPTLALLDQPRPRGKPVGTVSLRSVIPDILKDAGGVALHAEEILRRARERGADSSAKDPAGVIELMLYSAKKRRGLPVERVGRRTWRWAG